MPFQPAPTWDADLVPPAGFVEVRRTSKVWPSPIVEPFTGRVINWDTPQSEQHGFCGYAQIRINGVDVTWLEAGDGGPMTPTQIVSWEHAEPFDDAFAVINFPTIWPWDPLPDWLIEGCDVDIIWRDAVDRTLFEGLFISEENIVPGPSSLTIHCIGALYQLDLFVEPPPIRRRDRKVNDAIKDLVTDSRRSTRITPPSGYADVQKGTVDPITHVVTFTPIKTDRMGSFDSALTGAAADLLAYARTSSSRDWTIMKDPGRVMTIKEKTLPISGVIGWTVAAGAPGVQAQLARDFLSAPTAIFAEGTAPDGCRWRNMKTPAYTAATLPADDRDQTDQARVLPVAENFLTQAWRYLPDGTILGTNPFFDQTILQVEKFVAAGERIKLDEFASAASLDLIRGWPAKYRGTITLDDDPEEGHRRWIRAGSNIRFKYFRGRADGVVFHISNVSVDNLTGTVTLTVDENAHDFTQVDALIARVKDANDAANRGLRNQRASQQVLEQFATWDCEASGGRIAPFSSVAGTWKVVRFGAGELGTIVRSEFKASIPTRFSLAVFGYPVAAATLQAAGNPLTTAGFWQDWTSDETKRPLISWGGMLVTGIVDSAGFYPGLESEGQSPSGLFLDDGAWKFESTKSPFLWLACYTEDSCVVRGGWTDPLYRAFRIGVA